MVEPKIINELSVEFLEEINNCFFFRLILDPCKEVVQYSVYSVYKVSRVKMKVCSSSTSDWSQQNWDVEVSISRAVNTSNMSSL